MALKQEQIRYAKSRIEDVLRKKLTEVSEWERGALPALLSHDEKLAAIREGRAGDFKLPADAHYHTWVASCFTFPAERVIDAERERIQAVAKEKAAAVRAKARELLDGLILGDAAEALEKIREFEAMEVPS